MNIDVEINNYLSKLSESKKLLLLNFIQKLGDSNVKASIAERIISYNNELEEAV
jgi:hypothetical protein